MVALLKPDIKAVLFVKAFKVPPLKLKVPEPAPFNTWAVVMVPPSRFTVPTEPTWRPMVRLASPNRVKDALPETFIKPVPFSPTNIPPRPEVLPFVKLIEVNVPPLKLARPRLAVPPAAIVGQLDETVIAPP